ncbi:MAG: aspartate/glutamate racemase family protein [Pseudomonadota bacterium]
MKTIGLIGGTTWQSTADYYRILNEEVSKRAGDRHTAKILLASIDFQELWDFVHAENWAGIKEMLVREGNHLADGGADFFLICANTLHKVAEEVAKNVSIPLLSILDVVALELAVHGCRKVGLLGTRVTMEDGFFAQFFKRKGIEMIVPDKSSREEVHRVIFEEIARGRLEDASRRRFQEMIQGFKAQGAEGVVLGCTDLPPLIQQEHSVLPLFDTTRIHALAAVAKTLER